MLRMGLLIVPAAALVLAMALWSSAGGAAAPAAPAAPAKAAAPAAETQSVPFLGEYKGKLLRSGQEMAADGKVFGTGADRYEIVLSWTDDGKAKRIRCPGKVEGGKVVFTAKTDEFEAAGAVADKKIAATIKGKTEDKLELTFSVRKSPTEGEAPPEGAIVLLPYAKDKAPSLAEWSNDTWKAMPDGSMVVGRGNNQSKKNFGDIRLHLEFCIPNLPDKKGQDRGNSGEYFQGRYEVQVLDSFGLEPLIDGCGAIYTIKAPKPDAPLPPLQWQTYDIVFRAPKAAGGKMTEPAVFTVVHNGIKVQDAAKVDHTTTAGLGGPPVEKGPLMLQDHGSAVRFRNIWLKELKEGETGGL